MPTILERLDASITALRAEKARIQANATSDIAAVDAKLAILRDAKQAITPAVETAYAALLAAGFVRES